jgi:hypothetical protein
MGEEVTQSDVMLNNSAGSNDGTDETNEAAPAASNECETRNVVEKCDASGDDAEKSPKKPSTVKPQDNSFEKSRKWYNIGFMHRAGSSSNSRSTNTSENKSSVKMDNRHSWHLNDSLEM